jgi:hypothetical protein
LHSASDDSDGASDSLGGVSAPVVSSVGSIAGGGTTVEDIIEADLRAAAAALHRPLRSRGARAAQAPCTV